MNTKISKSPQIIFYFFLLLVAFFLMSCMVIFVTYYANSMNKEKVKTFSTELLTPTEYIAERTTTPVVDVCAFVVKPMASYNLKLAKATNSYFGLTDKKASNARMCSILQGPNYKTSLGGFSGELIQINAYDTKETSIDALYSFVELRPTTSPTSLLFDNTIRFARHSYGGADQIILFSNGKIIYEIIWRSEKNIDSVINALIEQLKQ